MPMTFMIGVMTRLYYRSDNLMRAEPKSITSQEQDQATLTSSLLQSLHASMEELEVANREYFRLFLLTIVRSVLVDARLFTAVKQVKQCLAENKRCGGCNAYGFDYAVARPGRHPGSSTGQSIRDVRFSRFD
jgi:hypothetical protein